MEHRAVFWHLISLRTQGSISQTSPPGSHFIISFLPIRTLPAAHTVAFLFMYLFIYLFLLFLSNRAVFCLKAPLKLQLLSACIKQLQHRGGWKKNTRAHATKNKKKKKNACLLFTQPDMPIYTRTQMFQHVCYYLSKPGVFSARFCTRTCTTSIAPPFLPDRFWQTQMAFFLVFKLFFCFFVFMGLLEKIILHRAAVFTGHLTQLTVAFYQINTVRLEIRRKINGFMIILQAEIRRCPTGDAVSISHWAFFLT